MTLIEIAAVALAVLYLMLASVQNRWCWAAGIASSLLYTYVCFSVNLLIESGLQVFYVIMGIAGWLNWSHNKNTGDFKPRNWTRPEAILFMLACGSTSVATGFLFSQYTQTSQPWLDACISVFSIGCTLLVVKKIIQNWPVWIIIDLAAAYLYEQRELRLSAMLYLLYSMMAIFGWIRWKKAI